MGNLRKQRRAVRIGSDSMTEYRREKRRMTNAAASIASKARQQLIFQLEKAIENAEQQGHATKKMKIKYKNLQRLEAEHQARVESFKKITEWIKGRKGKKTARRRLAKYKAAA